MLNGALGEIRTHTSFGQRFLRPPRLPFRHSGALRDYTKALASVEMKMGRWKISHRPITYQACFG